MGGGSVAQVGFGYWGTNHARKLNRLAGRSWRYLVDTSAQQRESTAAP